MIKLEKLNLNQQVKHINLTFSPYCSFYFPYSNFQACKIFTQCHEHCNIARYSNSTVISDFGPGRTGLTQFVWPVPKSRQNLSLPNFRFGNGGRT